MLRGCFATILFLGLTATSFAADDPTKPVDYEWVKITMNAAFAPRDGAGALSYKGRMWFLGG